MLLPGGSKVDYFTVSNQTIKQQHKPKSKYTTSGYKFSCEKAPGKHLKGPQGSAIGFVQLLKIPWPGWLTLQELAHVYTVDLKIMRYVIIHYYVTLVCYKSTCAFSALTGQHVPIGPGSAGLMRQPDNEWITWTDSEINTHLFMLLRYINQFHIPVPCV